jgi:peptidase M1-like protein
MAHGTRHRPWLTASIVVLGFLTATGVQAATEPAPEPSNPPALEALLQDFGALSLDERATTVHDRSLVLGRMTLTLLDGHVQPVKTGHGTIVGVFFTGEGSMQYAAGEPVERRLLESSLGRLRSGYRYADGVLTDRFTRGLVISGSDPMSGTPAGPVVAGGEGDGKAAAGEPPAGRGTSKWNDRLEETMKWAPLELLYAASKVNGGTFVEVSLEGGDNKYAYWEERCSRYEGRLRAYDPKAHGFSQMTEYRLTDAGRSVPPEARLVHARLEVETEDNLRGRIAGELTLRIERDNVRAISFGLDSHRNLKARGPTSEERVVEVRTIAGADDAPLEHAHRRHRLLVLLPAPMRRGDTVPIRFEIGGEIFAAPGKEDEHLGLGPWGWFPMPFRTEEGAGFTYAIRFRTRAPLVPVVPGVVKAMREHDGTIEVETEAVVPKRLLPIVAGDFDSREILAGTIPVRASLTEQQSRKVGSLPEQAAEILDYYGTILGPYPEEALALTAMTRQRIVMGESYPGLILLAPRALNLLAAQKNEGREILAHEIAHQWFGFGGFAVRSNAEAWLYQSMAEYASGLAMDALWGRLNEEDALQASLRRWAESAFMARKAGPMEGGYQGRSARDWGQSYLLVLGRGPLILHMLRGIAGDDRFFEILSRFLEEARAAEAADTDLLARVTGEVLGQDMGWFFDQWYRQPGIPKVEVRYRIETGGAGAVIAGRLVQEPETAFKRLRVPVTIVMADGAKEVRSIDQDRPTTEFRIELAGKPRKVEFDPLGETLATYSVDSQ